MDFLQAVLLSIVEGVSEFLPVSSTGHLILASELLKVSQTEFVKSFEIFIQLGAILAVVVLYGKKMLKNFIVWRNVVAGFLPTAVIGFALYKLIKHYLLGNLYVTLTALFVGGIALIILEKIYKEKEHHKADIESLTIKQCMLIGAAQSFSVIPGVSRSAASILGGMFLGAKRKTAVEYSFLLAIPTMLAASGLDLIKTDVNFDTNEIMLLVAGFLGAFITALFVVKWFIKFIQTNSFFWFGIYRIILSLLFFLLVKN